MLNKAYLANAIFSSVCAITMLVFSRHLNIEIPMGAAQWDSLAVMLLGFGVYLVLITCSQTWAKYSAIPVIIGDLLWVIVSTVLAVYFSEFLTLTGWLLIMLVNLFVGSFAYFQFVGFRLLKRADA